MDTKISLKNHLQQSSTISSFKVIKDKHNEYRGEDFMKKFCEYLKKHTRRITNFKKKNIKLLKNKQQESYENAKICYVCGETFEDNDKND